MRPIRLPAKQLIRVKTVAQATQILEQMPKGHAFQIGNEVRLVKAVIMTFSPADQ